MQHQIEGVEFLLSSRSGLLAFEQGLGKTFTAIAAFKRLIAEGTVSAMVVICPNSLKHTWQKELAQFAPELKTYIVSGSATARRLAMAATKAQVVIINYECARSEIIAVQSILTRRPSVLVLDESHAVKNFRSLSTIAALQFAPLVTYRWLLSGTPITNNPADVYPQLCIVAGQFPFGSFAAFASRYGQPDTPPSRLEELAARIKPYVLRRTKEDCLDLPEKTFIDLMIELPAWQRSLYDAMRDELLIEVRGMTAEQFQSFAPTALTRLLRLSQIASNPNLLIPDEDRPPAKLEELDRILDEAINQNHRKVIIWSQYIKTIRSLAKRYAGHGVVTLFGDTPQDDRQKIATTFQDDPNIQLLIANPAAAGTGFTLTTASLTVYETLSWRFDYYAQSQDRNHRIGQRNPVTYIRLIAKDTVEEAIIEALDRKANMARSILDDSSSSAMERLTLDSYRQMLGKPQIVDMPVAKKNNSGL